MSAIGDCCVCLEPLEYKLATIPCGHTFHESCITECIHNSGTCPTCRKSYKLHDIIKLYTSPLLNNGSDMDDEFRKIFHQLNQIVIKNKTYTDNLLKQLEDEKQKVDEYKTRWAKEASRREEAELRAIQAEIALEENEAMFKAKEGVDKEQIKNLKARLKSLIDPIMNELNDSPSVSLNDKSQDKSSRVTVQQSTSKVIATKPCEQTNDITKDIKTSELMAMHIDKHALFINLPTITFLFGFHETQKNKLADLKKFVASETSGICFECDPVIIEKLSKFYKKLHCFSSLKDTLIQLNELSCKTSVKNYEIQNGETTSIVVSKIHYIIKKIAYCWLIRSSSIHTTIIYMSNGTVNKQWNKTIEAFKEIPNVDFIFYNFHFAQSFTESNKWFEFLMSLYVACRPKNIIIFNILSGQIEAFKSKIKNDEEACQVQGIFKFILPGCDLNLTI